MRDEKRSPHTQEGRCKQDEKIEAIQDKSMARQQRGGSWGHFRSLSVLSFCAHLAARNILCYFFLCLEFPFAARAGTCDRIFPLRVIFSPLVALSSERLTRFLFFLSRGLESFLSFAFFQLLGFPIS